MVRISPDVGKNRVVIEFIGHVSVADLNDAASAAQAAIARLRCPVDVLSDIRELQTLDEEILEAFRRVGGVLGHFGVRRVVRVVGKSAKAAVQLERLSRSLKDHAAHLAFSIEEAEQVFAK